MLVQAVLHTSAACHHCTACVQFATCFVVTSCHYNHVTYLIISVFWKEAGSDWDGGPTDTTCQVSVATDLDVSNFEKHTPDQVCKALGTCCKKNTTALSGQQVFSICENSYNTV